MEIGKSSKLQTVSNTKCLFVFLVWLFSYLACMNIVYAQTNNPILLHKDDYASVSDDLLSRRWPNGVVHYELVNGDENDHNSGLTRRERFDDFLGWEELTSGAVRFVESDSVVPRISIELTSLGLGVNERKGRNSTGGLRGIREHVGTLITGVREIRIRPEDSYGVHHELGHVLGRWHHQRHPDSGACLTLDPTAPSRLHPSRFIGSYTSNSIMQYDAPQDDYRTWVDDPITCPVMSRTDPPTEFDILYFKKLYGVNGDYSNNTEWCTGPDTFVYTGDFNGDGFDDLLCHLKDGGAIPGILKVDYADVDNPNVFADGDWADESNTFCHRDDESVYVGDFNADGIDDLLCFNHRNGGRVLSYTDSLGRLNVSSETLPTLCKISNVIGNQRQLYIEDYDGDGVDDMLCHTRGVNTLTIDYAVDGFAGTDWVDDEWDSCAASQQVLIAGKFDEDNQTDLLCHDTVSGNHWIIYADNNPIFDKAKWSTVDHPPPEGGFCFGSGSKIYAADMTGNGLDDLVCHDRHIGSISIDYAIRQADSRNTSAKTRSVGSELWFPNYFAELSFCNAHDAFLSLGKFPTTLGNETEQNSLHCNNFATGHQAGRFSFRN